MSKDNANADGAPALNERDALGRLDRATGGASQAMPHRPNPGTAAKNQQFRWNAIAGITVAELLHHARRSGRFKDKELDKAALGVLTGKDLADAKAQIKGKGYVEGTVGHSTVKKNCSSTNPYGPPPARR